MKLRAFALCLMASSTQADVSATFRDGAPVDRFSFTVSDACIEGPVTLTIDLAGSDAGLIFDITNAGAGVEVFQPFVLTAGQKTFQSVSPVADGDTSLTLTLTALTDTSPLGFTIDLDDTIGQREITVSGAEIAGATVTIAVADYTSTGVFDDKGNAIIATPACDG